MYTLRDGKPFGADAPRICAPILAAGLPGLLGAARRAAEAGMVEWRADYFTGEEDLVDALSQIRAVIGGVPLIFTLRSPSEGGAGNTDEGLRLSLLAAAAQTGLADFVDAELRAGAGITQIAQAAKAGGTRLIVSYHDFAQTPSAARLIEIFREEAASGADAVKIAVTPQTPADVLALLAAADAFRGESPIPAIAVSMGKLGEVSRVYGHVFGSALTFASVDGETAPGQLSAARLGGFWNGK